MSRFLAGWLVGWFSFFGLILILILIERGKEWWTKRKAKKLLEENPIDILINLHRMNEGGAFFLGHDTRNIRADMDILSKRITNAFDYIGDLRSEYKEHEARFHTPKKPAGKPKVKK